MASVDLFPGQWQPQVGLMAALEVGLIEALLDQPEPPSRVARRLALDERATTRVLSALVDAGYLERRGEGVVVAPDARALGSGRRRLRRRPAGSPPRPAWALAAAARGAAPRRPGALRALTTVAAGVHRCHA